MFFWWGFFAKNFSTVDHLIVDYIVQNYPEQNSEATSLSRDCWKTQKEVPTLIIIIVSRKKNLFQFHKTAAMLLHMTTKLYWMMMSTYSDF